MSTPSALLLGLGIGVVIGWSLQHLDAKAMVRSILAMQLSLMCTAIGCAMIWMMKAARDQGGAALSFGLSEMILTMLPLAAAAALIHAVLGRVGRTASPLLVENRPIILGGLGGICGALLSGAAGSVQGLTG